MKYSIDNRDDKDIIRLEKVREVIVDGEVVKMYIPKRDDLKKMDLLGGDKDEQNDCNNK